VYHGGLKLCFQSGWVAEVTGVLAIVSEERRRVGERGGQCHEIRKITA